MRLASDHAGTALVRFDTGNSEIGLLVDSHSCSLQINQRSSGDQTRGKKTPAQSLAKTQGTARNSEQKDCFLLVLPDPLNAPGELAFVRSEAEGGGQPQLSPEAGRLLHPFQEVPIWLRIPRFPVW